MRQAALTFTVLLVLAAPLFAEEEAPAPEAKEPSGPQVFFKIGGGLVEQFETDLDDGGSFRVDRYYVRPGANVFLSRQLQVSLGVGFGEEHYRFFGDEGLGGADPWDVARSVSVGGRVRYALDGKWSLFGAPKFIWSVEEGADLGDGFTFGLFGGARYAVSETLTIGPGLGLLTQIEESPVLFPFLLIEWEMDDRWSLSTGSGLAATRGPGLVLSCQLADDWRIGLGGRWEQFRFRLDDEGPAPDGVGEESSLPGYLALTWKPTWRTSVSLLAGVNFFGRLSLYDEDGHELRREDYDPAPFVGVVFDIGL
ncbi:MAG: hypothetical protein ABFS86_04940 [Planctomycetota bacterium]